MAFASHPTAPSFLLALPKPRLGEEETAGAGAGGRSYLSNLPSFSEPDIPKHAAMSKYQHLNTSLQDSVDAERLVTVDFAATVPASASGDLGTEELSVLIVDLVDQSFHE